MRWDEEEKKRFWERDREEKDIYGGCQGGGGRGQEFLPPGAAECWG